MSEKILKSRRGDYVIWKHYRENIFTNADIDLYLSSFKGLDRISKLVGEEYLLMQENSLANYEKLCKHPFWKKEDKNLLCNYMDLYSTFHKKIKESEVGSKNIIATNSNTCITTLQLVYNYDNTKDLLVYQRSCDLSLGYLADLITLRIFMRQYNIKRLFWYIAVPHVYVNNLEKTIKQFREREKLLMNFNVRK